MPSYNTARVAHAACKKLVSVACMPELDAVGCACLFTGLADTNHVMQCQCAEQSICKKEPSTRIGGKMHERVMEDLKVFYTNINGFPNKMDELLLRIQDDDPDIIVLTECIPKAQRRPLSIACFSIGDNFTAYLNFDPELENMGLSSKCGVEILVRRDLNPSEVLFSSSFEEALGIKIGLKNNDELVLGVVYRSPSVDGHKSTEELCALLEMVHRSRPSHLVIVGDFNFKEIDWNLGMSTASDQHYTDKFIQATQNCFLYQHVTAPTHFMPNKMPSLLDLVLTSEEGMILNLSHCPPLGNSHHDCLTFKIRGHMEAQGEDPTARDLRNADFAAMALAIEQSDINRRLQSLDVQEGWECLIDFLRKLEDKRIPLKAHNKKRKHPYSNANLCKKKEGPVQKEGRAGYMGNSGEMAMQKRRSTSDGQRMT